MRQFLDDILFYGTVLIFFAPVMSLAFGNTIGIIMLVVGIFLYALYGLQDMYNNNG